MKVEGSCAIVTGGASGIGKAIAEVLLKKGGKVCVLDINKELGEQCVADFKKVYGDSTVNFIHCDVTNEGLLDNAFKEAKSTMDRLDIVVNNAAILGEARWEAMLEVIFMATCRGTLKAFDMLRKDKGGSGGVIINVASVAGLVPFDFMAMYCAGKHGVVGLTRALGARRDFDKTQVRLNVLCPDFCETPFVNPSLIRREHWGENFDWAIDAMTHSEKLSTSSVGEAAVELVENEEYQGTAMFQSINQLHPVGPPALISPNFNL